jgi:hypothetical protein
MTVRLEHANLVVRDIDATIRFLQAAFPEFRIRFDGTDSQGSRWVHIGTDDTYVSWITDRVRSPALQCGGSVNDAPVDVDQGGAHALGN